MNMREKLYMLPLIVMIFWIGIYPTFFLNKMEKSVEHYMKLINGNSAVVSTLNKEAKQ
jgi:NADH-quinone oxidoreductase subunit M